MDNFFFPDEDEIVYQAYPNIRFNMPGLVGVLAHKDSDEFFRGDPCPCPSCPPSHPDQLLKRTAQIKGTVSFLLTFTKMCCTNCMYIESEPDKGDFQPVNMKPNQLLHFNGNECVHLNHMNITKDSRVSMDFRLITMSNYLNNKKNYFTQDNPNRKKLKLEIGSYYSTLDLKN